MVKDIQLLFDTLNLIKDRIQPDFTDELEVGVWYPNGRVMPKRIIIS